MQDNLQNASPWSLSNEEIVHKHIIQLNEPYPLLR